MAGIRFHFALSLLSPVFLTGSPALAGDVARIAACSYIGLSSGVVDSVSATPSYYIANQTAQYWTAIAVRSQPGDDWDLGLYASLGPDPACVDTLLTFSNLSVGVDFVVADFNHASPATRYVELVRQSGHRLRSGARRLAAQRLSAPRRGRHLRGILEQGAQ